MVSQKALNEKLRQVYLNMVSEFLTSNKEEVLRVASNEICVPCVDENGNDAYLNIVFKVPAGERNGDPYDGYAIADDYARHLAEQTEKKAKAQAEKEKKIARDKADREAKAKAKAEAKAKKGE